VIEADIRIALNQVGLLLTSRENLSNGNFMLIKSRIFAMIIKM